MSRRKRGYGGLKGTIHGLKFDSGYEKKFIKICRQLGIHVVKSPHKIGYKESNKLRTYYPDFYWPLVDFTIEIKGTWAFRENHGFVKEKYAAAMVALSNRYTIITEKELTSDFVIKLYKSLLSRRLSHGSHATYPQPKQVTSPAAGNGPQYPGA